MNATALQAARTADARVEAARSVLRALPWEERRMHGVHRATGAGATLDYSLTMRGGADVYAFADVDPGIGSMGGADVVSSYRVDDCPAGTRAALCELWRAQHAAFLAWDAVVGTGLPTPVYVTALERHADELEASA